MRPTRPTIDPGARISSAPFFDEGYGYDVFGFCPAVLARVMTTTRAAYDRYFRVDSWGASAIPTTGPAILIANHAGVLPMDAAMLASDVARHAPGPRVVRPVADSFVPRLPWISTWFSRLGVVTGTRANVARLLERGELIAIWPEGVSGPAKRFADRYHLQRWSTGFAELAIRHRAPVIPVAIVGSEESWPLLAKLDARIFGAPYLPIPAVPLPLPARYWIRYGTPQMLGASRDDADDPKIVQAAADACREALERTLEHARMERRGWFR